MANWGNLVKMKREALLTSEGISSKSQFFNKSYDIDVEHYFSQAAAGGISM